MKPREELEELLGLDIPPVPEISLAGITSDSVLLYWKPPDSQISALKLSIRVNGINGKDTFACMGQRHEVHLLSSYYNSRRV